MPFDQNLLPLLSEPQDQPTPAWLEAIKKRKITGLIGDNGSYEVGLKNIKAQGQVNDLMLNGLLGYDGNWNLQARHPLWGGMLQLNAANNDGSKNYGLLYERKF